VNLDIRKWAAEQGIDLNERGRLPKAVIEQYEAAHPAPGDGEGPMLIVPEGPAGPPVDPAEHVSTPDRPVRPSGPPGVTERPPVPPKRQRRKMFAAKAKEPGKTPAKRLPRISTETLVGGAWSVFASFFGRHPMGVPAARMMMFQAPTIGVLGDDAIRGTWADRILQPLARASEKGEIVAEIIGPPVIVAACTYRPELYPVAQPVLKMLVMGYLERAEPAMEKIQQRISRMEDKLGGAQVDDILASVFADIEVPTRPSAAEEAAVKRARGE